MKTDTKNKRGFSNTKKKTLYIVKKDYSLKISWFLLYGFYVVSMLNTGFFFSKTFDFYSYYSFFSILGLALSFIGTYLALLLIHEEIKPEEVRQKIEIEEEVD